MTPDPPTGHDDDPFAGLFDDQPGSDQSGSDQPGSDQAESDQAESQPGDESGRDPSEPPRSRREARQAPERAGHWTNEPYQRESRRSHKGLWSILIGVLVLAGMGTAVVVLFQPQIASIVSAPDTSDYSGNGHGKIIVRVAAGDTGTDIARTLAHDGVVKTSGAFYQLLVKQEPQPTFYPGAYQLAKQMSAQAALSALQDPDNRVMAKVTIPEGTIEVDVLAKLAKATGISADELTAAAQDVTSFGVPASETSLEGYLFPATYQFDPNVSAHDAIARLVDEMFSRLDKAGVAAADRHRILTLASIVQREGGAETEDLGKIARVFQNRLEEGIPLQSDATVTYVTGKTQTVWTTDAERANAKNKYNTYAHKGLPPGPISNPGDAAIEAAIRPTPGPWLYFVTVNLKTGKTVFSATLDEHNAAVKDLHTWCEDPANAVYCK